jgi:hypothetical protein
MMGLRGLFIWGSSPDLSETFSAISPVVPIVIMVYERGFDVAIVLNLIFRVSWSRYFSIPSGERFFYFCF